MFQSLKVEPIRDLNSVLDWEMVQSFSTKILNYKMSLRFHYKSLTPNSTLNNHLFQIESVFLLSPDLHSVVIAKCTRSNHVLCRVT